MERQHIISAHALQHLGLGHQIQNVRVGVDDRSTGNPNLGDDIIGPNITPGHGGDPMRRIDEAIMPENMAARGVNGIQAVMLGRHINDVMQPRFRTHGDVHAGLDQRLGINLTIHLSLELFAECSQIHVRRLENGLLSVQTGVGLTDSVGLGITIAQHIHQREQGSILQINSLNREPSASFVRPTGPMRQQTT